MTGQIRVLGAELGRVRVALQVPHAFALERVGFIFGRSGGNGLILLSTFASVADEHYEPDRRVGARIGAHAINRALQRTLDGRCAAFHVHAHEHRGAPRFSPTDLRELPPVMAPCLTLVPEQPHGLLLLSHDSLMALVWYPGDSRPTRVNQFTVVDAPLQLAREAP